jgi:hypothetical protein
MKTFCDFSVTIHLEGDGLLGGPHEYAPYAETHTTFGDYKVKDKHELSVVSKRPRPDAIKSTKKTDGVITFSYDDEIITYKTGQLNFRMENYGEHNRVDSILWTELWCHTRLSGVPDMDKRESEFVERHVSEGIFPLEMYSIITAYKEEGGSQLGKPFLLRHSITDDKVVEEKVKQYARHDGNMGKNLRDDVYNRYLDRAYKETHKGRLVFEITMNQFSEESYIGSVYHIKGFKSKTMAATLATHKPKSLSSLESEGGENIKTRASSEFTPISYTSKSGMERMLHTMHNKVLTPYARHFMKLSDNDPEPLYKPLNQNVAYLQLPMWVSKMGRLPVACYWSCHDPSTREYASKALQEADLRRYGFDDKTEHYLTRLFTSSLRRHGMSVQRFSSLVGTHFSLDNKSAAIDPDFLLCEEIVADVGTFAANTSYYTSDYRMVRDGVRASMVQLDSWDNTILNDSGRSDDCEGMDNTAATIIRSYGIGRYDMGFSWKSPLLNSVKLFLDNTVMFNLGATVTSAYVDNNNKNIDMRQKDLPMVDDDVDKMSHSDGHCHALMEATTLSIQRLRGGNISDESLARVIATSIQCKYFMARDGQRRTIVLESTGSIEPRILPLKESYEGHDLLIKKKCAERDFVKGQLKAGLEKRKEMGEVDISEMFTGDSLQHYVEKQDPNRRASNFYKEIVHGISLELWKRTGDPALAQLAFGTKKGGEVLIGAKIASFMRNPDKHPLILPFQSHREEWVKDVVPLMESVQHQLPIMAFGRYSDTQYANTHSNYISITTGVKNSESNSLKDEQQKFEKLAFGVSEDPSLSIVKLQSREWKLRDTQKNQQLHSFLTSRKGVVAVGYYSEHQLPVCDPMIDIQIIIDLNKIND